VATFLAEMLLARYPALVSARYGFPTEGIDGVAVIEGIAKRRAYRLKGGEPDLEKAAHTLLQDYRSGALGRISLETPQSRVDLLASYQPPPSLGEAAEEDADGSNRHRGDD
jgi:ribosome biogenesis GTPase A